MAFKAIAEELPKLRHLVASTLQWPRENIQLQFEALRVHGKSGLIWQDTLPTRVPPITRWPRSCSLCSGFSLSAESATIPPPPVSTEALKTGDSQQPEDKRLLGVIPNYLAPQPAELAVDSRREI